jgi:hypothetical protein
MARAETRRRVDAREARRGRRPHLDVLLRAAEARGRARRWQGRHRRGRAARRARHWHPRRCPPRVRHRALPALVEYVRRVVCASSVSAPVQHTEKREERSTHCPLCRSASSRPLACAPESAAWAFSPDAGSRPVHRSRRLRACLLECTPTCSCASLQRRVSTRFLQRQSRVSAPRMCGCCQLLLYMISTLRDIFVWSGMSSASI